MRICSAQSLPSILQVTVASKHVCLPCRALQATPLNDFERACVSNLNPHSAEEAKALLPSLDVSHASICKYA